MSSGVAVLWVLAGALATVGLILGVQTALSDVPFPASWHQGLTLAMWALVLPVPGLAWDALQAQRAVWRARVSPRAAVKAAERAFRRTLGWTLTLALLPLALIGLMTLPLPQATLNAAGLWALMAGSMSFGLLFAAAWRGDLPAAWAWPWIMILIAVPVTLLPAASWALWAAAEGWRGAVMLAMGLAPLAALGWSARTEQNLNAVDRGGRAGRGDAVSIAPGLPPEMRGLRARIAGWKQWLKAHVSPIDGPWGISMAGYIVSQLPQQLMMRREEGLLFRSWGSEVTVTVGYRVGFLALWVVMLTASPALHWRHLLAPGGSLRQRLGHQIIFTTWLLVTGVLAIMLAVVGGGILLFSSDRAELLVQLPSLLLRYAPLFLLDLWLACALAAVVRALAGTQLRAVFAFIGLIGVWGLTHLLLLAVLGSPMQPWGTRNAWALIVTLMLIGLLHALAQQAWARADLSALLRSSREREADPTGEQARGWRPQRLR
ncbi:MAG: hypothetical protein JNJ71_02825 [Rubrivivax sp.]|nr:hypothetical protein [Rubrivivax sp.]